MATLTELIAASGLTLSLRAGEPSPEFSDPFAHHYRATLALGKRTMTTPFHTGSGWTAEPDAHDVLECLLSDASSLIGTQGYDAWAGEYGYDTYAKRGDNGHSYKVGQRIYHAITVQTDNLRVLLSDDFDAWLTADTSRE